MLWKSAAVAERNLECCCTECSLGSNCGYRCICVQVNKLIFWHLCCRKHQRKVMRKFNIILIALCHFLPTSCLILYQGTPHWRCNVWCAWGREDLLVCPPGFPLWVDFSENTQWHVFALFCREASWTPPEKGALLGTAQQIIGKYFDSPARTH